MVPDTVKDSRRNSDLAPDDSCWLVTNQGANGTDFSRLGPQITCYGSHFRSTTEKEPLTRVVLRMSVEMSMAEGRERGSPEQIVMGCSPINIA